MLTRVGYDNLRAAVVRILIGGARTLTPRFTALASFAGDEKLAMALLDRFAHHATVLTTKARAIACAHDGRRSRARNAPWWRRSVPASRRWTAKAWCSESGVIG